MLKNTNLLAGNFETMYDAELAAAMLCTFAEMNGLKEPKFQLEMVAKNFYRLTQKPVRI
jgi:hypothetical protein